MEKQTEAALVELVTSISQAVKTLADIVSNLSSRVSELENK